jgi:putative toxin-antitoxin system antitoxin component (TIGR02293 family)
MMPRAEACREISGAFPLEEVRNDLEWLHHAFTPEKRAQSKALSTVHVRSERRGVAIVGTDGSKSFVDFRRFYEAAPMEQVCVVKRGVNARLIDVLATSMQIPKAKLIGTLGLARATIQRKCRQQTALSSDETSRVIGMSKLIGQVQAMVDEAGAVENFAPAAWAAQWLDQTLPALNGRRPRELMDTAEGQAAVSQLLGRLQSGAYT